MKQLKPICVPLSQLAIRSTDKAADAKEILSLIESLTNAWEDQASRDPTVLDDKLADYVFFPLSHVLRSQDQYPIRLIEGTIKLLSVLIRNGWKGKISKELSQQLLIFLTFVIGGVPGQEKKRHVPEETLSEGYRALGALVTASGSTASASALLEDQIIPTLGHSISVVLDGVTNGTTPDIQLAALDCLEAFYSSIKDHSVLATFLPGTVSSLSRALSPPLSLKAQKRVLVRGLAVLGAILSGVLGDIRTRNILKDTSPAKPEENGAGKVLTPAWLNATASQIKIALSSVLKLRSHESEEVQLAVSRLCICLLDECHSSLAECKSVLVESAMMTESGDAEKSIYHTSLEDLTSIYPELGDTIRGTLYNWVIGLPRVMQSSHGRVKQQAIRNVIKGNKLAASLKLDSTTLDDSLADSLKDSMVALLLGSKPQKMVADVELDEDTWKSAALSKADSALQEYRPVLLAEDSQQSTRNEIRSLTDNIGSSSQKTKLAAELLTYLRDSRGEDQIASFWLSFELVKASSHSQSSDLDTFLDLTFANDREPQDAVFQELYDFSVSVVTSHSDTEDTDWRLEAIALEVTAFAASRMQDGFRPELIDVLYPITTFMGSQHPRLRRHAMITLNKIAASCGYGNVSELIIDNADYMVNSISLRLNTFDISPASTRVLSMMIRLTGPRLIPFLDDAVAAIFAALDNYHGYPLFVESLFSVLSEIVRQGVKSDTLLIEEDRSKRIDHKKNPPNSEGIEGILDLLEQRAHRRGREAPDLEETDGQLTGHPKEPWGPPKSKTKSFIETLKEADETEEGAEDAPASGGEKPKPPATPTYALLTRVTTLTQHYLTSPTPTLRKSLLDLVTTVSPALAPDEDSFLPTINALWPVVIARLHDPEPFVVVAACGALGALCASAGDFLASRVKTEWGSWLARWCGRVRDEAGSKGPAANLKGKKRATAGTFPSGRASGGLGGGAAAVRGEIVLPSRPADPSSTGGAGDMKLVQTSSSSSSSPSASAAMATGLGRFAQAAQVWVAVAGLLTAIVSHVRVDDDVFDQVLDLLGGGPGDVLQRDAEARRALEDVNADAVWLALYERGHVARGPAPVLEGVEFARMVEVV